MLFLIAFGVPEKSVFTRLFGTLQKLATANCQDRLVVTASQHSPIGEIFLRANEKVIKLNLVKELKPSQTL